MWTSTDLELAYVGTVFREEHSMALLLRAALDLRGLLLYVCGCLFPVQTAGTWEEGGRVRSCSPVWVTVGGSPGSGDMAEAGLDSGEVKSSPAAGNNPVPMVLPGKGICRLSGLSGRSHCPIWLFVFMSVFLSPFSLVICINSPTHSFFFQLISTAVSILSLFFFFGHDYTHTEFLVSGIKLCKPAPEQQQRRILNH